MLVVQGTVENWRIARKCAFLISSSMVQQPVDIFSWIPLPYDQELLELMGEEREDLYESIEDFYKRRKKEIDERKKNNLKIA